MATKTIFLSADEAMDGEQIAAPIRTPINPGSGRARIFLDQASGNVLLLGTFTPLSSRLAPRETTDSEHPSASHLHAGAAGDNGGVIRHLHAIQNADLAGRFGTDSTLNARQMDLVTSGNSYALIHTVNNFGGEIRGQLDTFSTIAGLLGDATAETIRGSAATEVIMGLGGDDVLIGGGGDDVLSGGAGNDVLVEGIGVDWLSGGAGNDRYIVDDSVDQVFEFADEGTDIVFASIDYVLADDSIENLTLVGSAAIDGAGNAVANHLRGNAADNVLSGAGGDDILVGGAGSDRLLGGAGRDVLTGGTGDDSFVYLTVADSLASDPAGRDVIRDFTQGSDTIDLQALGMTAFVGAFSGTAGEVRATSNANATFVQFDADGDRIADLTIQLVGQVALTSGDFVGF